MSSEINSSLEVLFNKMENFISSKTVIGEPITLDGTIVLPLVDISFGVGAGGSSSGEVEKDGKKKDASSGSGGGLGAKIIPSAVIVIVNGNVQLINLKNQDGLSKLIDMTPGIISKLNLQGIFEKNKKDNDKKEKRDVKISETHFVEEDDNIIIKKESVTKETNL